MKERRIEWRRVLTEKKDEKSLIENRFRKKLENHERDKRLRARGGCLGTCWRRRTVKATKESGELPIKR